VETGLRPALAVYVINLRRAAARRGTALDQLRKPDLVVDVIEAVDGRSLVVGGDRRVVGTRYLPRLRRRLGAGELGCSLSHMRALLAFLSSDAPLALVLEDDFEVTPGGWERLDQLLSAGLSFDVLKLGSPPGSRLRDPEVWRDKGLRVVATLSPSTLSHAYVVTRAGAQRLVSTPGLASMPFDLFLRDTYRHRCRVLEVEPSLIGVGRLGGESAIAGERDASDRMRPVEAILAWLRIRLWRLEHNLRRHCYAIRIRVSGSA
jgi:glycosyl transferase family 25